MKQVFGLILLFLLASCGSLNIHPGQFRLVKTANFQKVILDKTETKFEENIKLETATINPIESEFLVQNSSDIIVEQKQSKNYLESENHILKENFNKQERDDLEPDEDSEEFKQAMVQQALKAEKQAKTAKILSGIGLISILLPWIGIFFMIPGLFFLIASNNSRFITPTGQEDIKTSKNLLIADFIFVVLWIGLILAILFFL